MAEIEAKQTAGTLDLSDTNDATVAAILQIKEAQEVITQTGLDADFVADITAIATEAAATNQLIATQVASGGIQVLTNSFYSNCSGRDHQHDDYASNSAGDGRDHG